MRAARKRISSMALPWLSTVASSSAMRTLTSRLDAAAAGGSTGCSGFGAGADASAGGGGGGATSGATGAGGVAGATAAVAIGSASSTVESCSTGRHSLHCSTAPAGTSRHAHTRMPLLVRSGGRVSTQRLTCERVVCGCTQRSSCSATLQLAPRGSPTALMTSRPDASCTGKAARNKWTAKGRGEHG
jgi:hypothetical protein